jgi:arginine N-succinyltransferase
MFLVRSVRETDIDDLYSLSSIVLFINLPKDRNIIKEKIQNSIKSFQNSDPDLAKNTYIFVLEDVHKSKVIGVSMIHAKHGTEKEPHFFLRVSQEYKYSKTINTGFIHGTLKLGLDTNGPTEIGGLVISPEYRGHSKKLGKLLSFSRFLYIAMYPEKFKEQLHSELMPPLGSDGKSPLWEAIGRRFMNMDYAEADQLSRNNKEFILSLYPSDNIYQTLLPIEARNSIGKVSKETMPVKSMLEKIGFTYAEEVDPFDGGPHYKANTKDVSTINSLKAMSIKVDKSIDLNSTRPYLISVKLDEYFFSAVKVDGIITPDSQHLLIKSELPKLLSDNQHVNLVEL